ncbi:MAG: hypothetical protein C0453_06295 [Comamonadaceae bacterium]|nr:hypothetical protein [Comamonadaceae bacterium]
MALLLAISVGLSACGGGKGGGQEPKTPPPPPEPTPQEKIAQLEAQGQLPQLERLPLVAGIDIDNDGVRDDIAEHIRRTYTEPVQYRAAMQMARVHQAMLLVDKHDHIALQEVSERSMKAIACLHQVFSLGDGPPEGTRVREEIRSMTTNTKERLQTYLAYNKARSGSISVRPEGSVCE